MARGTLIFGPDMVPRAVHHHAGHRWMVWEVLGHWKPPLTPAERLRTGEVVESWRLRVSGPLPGEPGKRGEFVMVAETYGNRPGWWLSPGGG